MDQQNVSAQAPNADPDTSSSGVAPATAQGSGRALPLATVLGTLALLAAVAAAEQRFELGAPFRPILLGDTAQRPSVGSNLNAVCASGDGGQITVVGDGGLILYSGDGGRTWRRESLPASTPEPGPESAPQSLPKRSGLDGWPLGAAWAGDPKELDALKGQQSQSIKDGYAAKNAQMPPPNAQQQQPLDDVKNQQAAPQKDAGYEPEPVAGEGRPVRSGPAQAQNLYALSCGADGAAWAVGGGGVIGYRSRAGEPWALARTPGFPELYAVDFRDGVGWAAGESGNLWRSDDAGRSWSRVQRMLTDRMTFLALKGRSAQGVVAVGGSGLIFDLDNPSAAKQTSIPVNARHLRVLLMTAPDTALALGDGGTLVEIPADADPRDLSPGSLLPDTVFSASILPTGPAAQTAAPAVIWTVGPRGRFFQFDLGARPVRALQDQTLAGGRDLHGIQAIDADRAWIVGASGVLLATDDGGRTWQERARSETTPADRVGTLRLPSPAWFLLALIAFIALLLLARRRRQKDQVPIDAVAQATVSDRPLSGDAPDALGLRAIARALAAFMLNESTCPPLTIAVRGPWGSGKSSLMSLLCDDLEKRTGYRPVWFNAWHHQSGEQLLASLFACIRAQAMPRIWSFAGLSLRTDLLWLRTRRSPTWTLLMLALAGVFLFSITHEQDFLEVGAGIALSKLLSLVDASNAQATEDAARTLGPLGAALLPLLALIQTLRAFKLNPAALVTAATAGGSAQKHQPAARHRFAAEFEDFTMALRPWRLVLVIDDLDRCTPEHIAEIMETVNFLVTSGECFVVLGMETLWVEAALAVELEKLSAKMEERRVKAQRPEDEDLIHRYLRKLINIEIKVPEIGREAALRVLSGTDNSDDTADAAALRQTAERLRLGSLRKRRRAVIERSAAALVAVGLVGGSYLGSRYVPTPKTAAAEPQAAAASSERTLRCEVKATQAQTLSCVSTPATENQVPAADGAPPDQAAAATAVEATLTGRREPQAAIYSAAAEPTRLSAAALATAVMVLMLAILLRLRSGSVLIRDSREFADALRIWLPLIVRRVGTPRDLKRFLNLLRYLAARLPPDADADPRDAARLVAYVVLRKLMDVKQPAELMRATLAPNASGAKGAFVSGADEVLYACMKVHADTFGDAPLDSQRLKSLAILEAEIDFR